MRRILVSLLVVAGSLPGGPASAAPPWHGEPTLVSGTSRLDGGEWIHTDFVYDDYGADTGPAWGQPNVVSLAPTAGDARYPDGDAFAGNAADIVEVRARALGDDLQARVLLQTITDPATPAIWVQAGEVTEVFTAANAEVDVAANTVTFTVPDVAGGDTIDLNVGAGLSDGAGGLRAGVPGNAVLSPGELTTGGPTDNRLLDLAFNAREIEPRGGAWNETAQSAALAAGDLEPFAQTINVGDLRGRATTPVPQPRGYSVRLFESRQDLGEGVAGEFPQYRGWWQPYAVWVPEGYEPSRPAPLFLSMHSLSVHHNQYRGGTNSTYTTYYEQFGDALGAVVVTPLARGPDGWYRDEGLIDTLEVWSDALRRYAIDRDRVWVGGYSMGGYGTYRLTTMMPDSFASAVSVVGPPGNGIWAYPGPPPGGEGSPDWTYPQLESTLHVPFWITHGAADELVPVTSVKRQADRLAELGHEHRFALHPAADHLSFAAQDEWSREAAWFEEHPVRTEDPAEVTYKLRPASWATGGDPAILEHLETLATEVGANIDGAYWVDDVEVAGDGDVTGLVDLTSSGIRRRRDGVTPITTAGTGGPSPHLLTGADVTYGEADAANELTGRLSGVSALTIDVGRAGLSSPPELDIEADREVRITFVRNGAMVGKATVGPGAEAGHSAEHATVTNPEDGTQIAITIFEPAEAAERDVPVVLHSHGWAGTRETDVGGLVAPFLDAGFGVVSIDQRGHGESSGQAHVQDPTRETEDIQAVIDHVAALDWVELERPGDPVLGAIGLSYGGGFQTMTALDEIAETGSTRFDALAPEITWFDLPESLAPQGVVRTAWNFLLLGVGAQMVPQHIHEAFAWGTATGQWPDGTLYGQPVPGAPNLDAIFHEHSPAAFVERGIRIDIPVLLRQGTSDNLFPLNEGLDNFQQTLTQAARKRSFFVAFNGGHALPNAAPRGEPAAVEVGSGLDACNEDFAQTTIEFFDRVFRGTSTKGVLPGRYNMTTLGGDECLHASRLSGDQPIEVDPTGTGVLPLSTGAGAPLHIPVAEGPHTLAGVPTLRGTATAAGVDTRVFFGLARGTSPADATVIQNNLLPLRRVLPAQDQEFSIELPGIVAEVPEGETLFLTISPISDLYFGHGSRTPGAMVLSDLRLTLPTLPR